MNNIQLMGRLTADPEIRYTEAGKCVCQFTMAVDRAIRKDTPTSQKTDFIPCVAFDKAAEDIGNNISKGQRLIISRGTVHINRYKNKEGKNSYHPEVQVFSFEYVEKRGNYLGEEVEAEEVVF